MYLISLLIPLGTYNQKTGKYEGEFNQPTLNKLNKNRTAAGLPPVSKTDQYGNVITPVSMSGIDTGSTQATAVDTTASAGTVASTGSSVAGVDLLTTPQTPDGTASGITVPPSPLNAQSGALVRQNETLKLSPQSAPAPAVVQAPAPSSGGGQAIMPPASIDDYGLAFANKLLWDK